MKRSDELKQQRGNKMDELTAISATAANQMLTEEQRGKAALVQAEAQKVLVEVDRMRSGVDGDGAAGAAAMEVERSVAQVREQAAR